MAAGRVALKPEWLARTILVLSAGLVLLVAALGWRAYHAGLLLQARMAEAGGWSPAAFTATVGQPLHLRLTSDDVTHSFAVGGTDWPAVDVYPGEVTQATLTFERPSKYVFYCTRWCGPNHWRMRGTIEVSAAGGVPVEPAVAGQPPLYVTLGLDLDAPHPASATPQARPSAAAGSTLLPQVPPAYRASDYLRSHSPAQAWGALRSLPLAQALSDQQVWDLVAALWQAGSRPAQRQEGQELYAQNCAACHGESGAGDGVFADQAGTMPDAMSGGQERKSPTDFTDPGPLLGASPALLQGKIVRGGMGSGMPYWGPIFTEEQTWALVAYLYTFQFDEK